MEHAEPADQSLEESLLGDESSGVGGEVSTETTKLELKALLKLSAPLMVQLSSQYAIIIVNQYFIGHLGPAPLAAAAIGNTVSCSLLRLNCCRCTSGFVNISRGRSVQWFNFCWYFLLGVSTALDTLGSQAHGEGNPNGVISCCVSAISVLSLLCVPVSVAMLTANTVAQKVFFQTPEAGQVFSDCVCCQGILKNILVIRGDFRLTVALSVYSWWESSAKLYCRDSYPLCGALLFSRYSGTVCAICCLPCLSTWMSTVHEMHSATLLCHAAAGYASSEPCVGTSHHDSHNSCAEHSNQHGACALL